MNLKPDHATRPARATATKGLVAALMLTTGLIGAAALTSVTAPVHAQSGLPGNQVLTPTTFSVLAEKVTPSVVAVRVTGAGDETPDIRDMFPRNSPFRDFFDRYSDEPERFERRRGDRRPGDERRPTRPRMSQGSGFIISSDGHIVTNNHVIDGAESISVVVNGGDEYDAEVLGTDPRTDLAVLKIKSDKALPNVEFSGAEAKVGDWVMAVGNPFGLGGSVTTGIVSARGRQIGSGPYDDYIQIDAAVNRGNSGGPTFNLDGEVIGVNTAIYSPNGGSVGIGFAIPASVATKVIDQLIDHGQIVRGWIGVSIQNLTSEIADSVGLDEPAGAIIAEIFEGGPAAKSELQTGDVVLEVNEVAVATTRDLARMIGEVTPGETVKLLVVRDRAEITVDVTSGTMPKDPERVARAGSQDEDSAAESKLADLGLNVVPAADADPSGDARGVVVTAVEPGSEASDKGIRRGDLILRVAGIEVNTAAELGESLSSAREEGLASVLVLLRSRGGQRFVTLDLTKA